VTSSNQKPYVIGITGTIGSGKSLVGAIIERHGIPVIDTDKLVHSLLDSPPVQKQLQDRFGKRIMAARAGEDAVDRAALARIVFADDDARKDLEAIVHPATILECRKQVTKLAKEHVIAKLGGRGLVAVLVPLLFEAGLADEYDEIWTVYAEDEVLKQRLQKRDNLNSDEIEKRLAAQLPQKEKALRATQVIDNSGTKEKTERQVELLLKKLIGE
jgi:dephospho-CoA kinase